MGAGDGASERTTNLRSAEGARSNLPANDDLGLDERHFLATLDCSDLEPNGMESKINSLAQFTRY